LGEIGEVTNGKTLNYKTLKPETGGLFCQRIFGPVNDFQCACGKHKTQENLKFVPICGVEYISSRSRRHKMGWIELATQ
jgi:DNA-directed RNA polymerase subunit beta'